MASASPLVGAAITGRWVSFSEGTRESLERAIGVPSVFVPAVLASGSAFYAVGILATCWGLNTLPPFLMARLKDEILWLAFQFTQGSIISPPAPEDVFGLLAQNGRKALFV